jgi:hypothetical protein
MVTKAAAIEIQAKRVRGERFMSRTEKTSTGIGAGAEYPFNHGR